MSKEAEFKLAPVAEKGSYTAKLSNFPNQNKEGHESISGGENTSSARNSEMINLESVTIPASPNAVVNGLIENRRVNSILIAVRR